MANVNSHHEKVGVSYALDDISTTTAALVDGRGERLHVRGFHPHSFSIGPCRDVDSNPPGAQLCCLGGTTGAGRSCVLGTYGRLTNQKADAVKGVMGSNFVLVT